MKNIFQDLWCCYLSEQGKKREKEETELVEKFLTDEKVLYETFNEEQKKLYDKMEKSLSEINDISERDAFVKGIKFGSGFVFEAFCKDE